MELINVAHMHGEWGEGNTHLFGLGCERLECHRLGTHVGVAHLLNQLDHFLNGKTYKYSSHQHKTSAQTQQSADEGAKTSIGSQGTLLNTCFI